MACGREYQQLSIPLRKPLFQILYEGFWMQKYVDGLSCGTEAFKNHVSYVNVTVKW